jgi:hypothetical protein
MALYYGMGSPDFTTLGLNPERLLPVEPMGFTIDGASEKKESKKYRDGKVVTAGSALASDKYTAKCELEAANWLAIQWAYGELAGLTPSVALPDLQYLTVPGGATPEIAISDLSDANVLVTVMQAGSWGKAKPLTRVTGSTINAGEFKADLTSTPKKLIFNTAQSGAPIGVRRLKNYTNIESLFAEQVFTTFSAFSFSGLIYGDEETIKIYIPKITRSNIPSLDISDITKFSLEYEMIVTGSFRSAFQLYNLTTAGIA